MNLILVSREEADQRSLMHYRTKGSKNGERRYQRENGSLTPLGYMHYAAMYGWGKMKSRTPAEKAQLEADMAQKQADRRQYKADKKQQKAEKLLEREKRLNRSDKEIEKDVEDSIKQFNEKTAAAAKSREEAATQMQNTKNDTSANQNIDPNLRAAVGAGDEKKVEDRKKLLREARGWSDEDLQKAITRLQKEKQYSELLNERENREQGPVRQMVSKLIQDAAQDLAKKSLGVVVDKLVNKMKGGDGFKLSDYKNVDLYSLDSNKLQAVSQAFNNAAQIALNKWKMEHPGQDPNQQKNNDGGAGDKSKKGNDDNSGTERPNGPNGQLSKKQKQKIRNALESGESAAELAKRFGVPESTIYNLAPANSSGNNTDNAQTQTENSSSASNTESRPRSESNQPSDDSTARKSKKEETSKQPKLKRRDQLDLTKVKTPERKPNESMADYWDRLLLANGAKTAPPTESSGTTMFMPLSDLKTPERKDGESMADYWDRLIDENRSRIITTAPRR